MALAAEQYTRLRQDVGFAANDTAGFPDTEIDDLYVEAAEDYPQGGVLVVKLQTRVIALGRIWIDTAKLTTYQQNHSLEKLEDVFKHLQQAVNFWTGERDKAGVREAAVSNPAARPSSFTTRVVAGW